MKKIELYQCDLCNGQFSTEEQALKCEQEHPRSENIFFNYDPCSVYPDRIVVNFSNREQMVYKLV